MPSIRDSPSLKELNKEEEREAEQWDRSQRGETDKQRGFKLKVGSRALKNPLC